MRVVSGIARGRKIAAPPGTGTRPTSDRVREAVFNALGSLGALDGARVLDLFAGSGALGIEAISRGAAHATFVDSDLAAVRAIEANLEATGLGGHATVVAATADAFLARADHSFDLVLADPPYAFDAWADLLDDLPADLVVAESDRAIAVPPGWQVVREKRYGSTVVTITRRTTARRNDEEPA